MPNEDETGSPAVARRRLLEGSPMLRSAGIRSKILAVLVVPLVLLAITTGLLGTSQVLRAREAYQVENLADVGAVLPQLTADLALERSTTKAALQGDAAAAAALPELRSTVDAGIVSFDTALADVDLDRLPTRVTRAVSDAQTAHDELARLRTGVDDRTLLLGSVSSAFDEVLDAHLQLPGRVGPTIADQETAAGFIGLGHLLVARDLYLDEQEIGLRLLRGTATTSDVGTFRGLGGAQSAELARWEFAAGAPEGGAAALDAVGDLRGTAWSVASARNVLSGLSSVSGLTPEIWVETTTGRVSAVDAAVDSAVATVLSRSAQASGAATALAAAAVMAAVLGVGVTVLLSLLLARRISRPLRELTAAATTVREQLPIMVEQMRSPGQMPDVQLPRIEVVGDDEVGRLAAAFNAVNDTVVAVAEEQAAMRGSIAETFVNVARRNQVLLSRQLSFIDQLEQREENPDTLENLFRLDHLATRMRRNAESLLVLANIDAGRRLRQPLALSDVIRTAASEIEQYERVNLALQVDPPTMGHLSLQLAHLLAELLENGTNFSEPHTPVLVATSRTATGIRITVTDEGLGLTEDEIETARAKISDFAADDVVTSQRLGFFVVGRLARRLGVTVSIHRGSAKGLVVTVDLPPSLFVPGTVKVADPGPGRAVDPSGGPAAEAAPGRTAVLAGPVVAPVPGAAPPGAKPARPPVPAARPGSAPARQDAPTGAPAAHAASLPARPAAARPPAAQPSPRATPPVVPARPAGTSIPMPGASSAQDPAQPVTVTPGGIALPPSRPAGPRRAAARRGRGRHRGHRFPGARRPHPCPGCARRPGACPGAARRPRACPGAARRPRARRPRAGRPRACPGAARRPCDGCPRRPGDHRPGDAAAGWGHGTCGAPAAGPGRVARPGPPGRPAVADPPSSRRVGLVPTRSRPEPAAPAGSRPRTSPHRCPSPPVREHRCPSPRCPPPRCPSPRCGTHMCCRTGARRPGAGRPGAVAQVRSPRCPPPVPVAPVPTPRCPSPRCPSHRCPSPRCPSPRCPSSSTGPRRPPSQVRPTSRPRPAVPGSSVPSAPAARTPS
jgi:anti-sigma regulatory factor (Ser/Thr protein kinase)/HAMP domain-containing protein